jgi:hypothetical protein
LPLNLNTCSTINNGVLPVQWKQRDAISIQFIKNQGPLHVSSITCSSSEGAIQTALGILRACYVSWLLPGLESVGCYQASTPTQVPVNWHNTHAIYHQVPFARRLLRMSK